VIEMPKTGGEGVIVAEGSKSAGFPPCRTANSYTVLLVRAGTNPHYAQRVGGCGLNS
jgi:hypothetical protein